MTVLAATLLTTVPLDEDTEFTASTSPLAVSGSMSFPSSCAHVKVIEPFLVTAKGPSLTAVGAEFTVAGLIAVI